MTQKGLTPIRKQYLKIKNAYPQAIVLFRLGDFYETFDKDAEVSSRELNIILTSREMGKGNRVPMAGIPYHSADNYIARLINRGYKVAVCEQITKPEDNKGIVERDVVRVITPGTVIEPSLLNSKANNYLVSLIMDDKSAGIAYIDITTSDFAVTQAPIGRVNAELARLNASEIIVSNDTDTSHLQINCPISRIDNHRLLLDRTRRLLHTHFGVTTLEGYGCNHLPLAIRAAGSIIDYLHETQRPALNQITGLKTYSTESFMALDAQTQRNLELFHSGRSNSPEYSLLSVIDMTRTPMGSRMLKRWLGQPLLDIEELTRRQEAIESFFDKTLTLSETVSYLDKVSDLERLINRVRNRIATPRELISLKNSLEIVPKLIQLIETVNEGKTINIIKSKLNPCHDITELIRQAIVDNPSTSIGDGSVVRQGFSKDLDSLRLTNKNTNRYLANLESQEREKTGIKSLKLGYNRVFGYYIEVSKANLNLVPQSYIRKQTLVGGERYFTPELKEYEAMILNARDRIAELESDIFLRICGQIADSSEQIISVAEAVASIDVVTSLANVAICYSYVRPSLTDTGEIVIKRGRHPTVERGLPVNSFVPNDTHLSNYDDQLVVLTGPNMSGKSTYLKQVALIVLMAQTGSFVPADYASIGIVDRIFTRIGAGEDIAAGQSTFMVEMVETANILNNATTHSLIILDEIGRGTSTYDGLSIARAVCEYIHNNSRLGAKTLFATHYHELVKLAGILPRVKNLNIAVTEEDGKIIFLYRINPGGVDKSYGIHVAQLAGLPKSVIQRANKVLEELEGSSNQRLKRVKAPQTEQVVTQMSFFGQHSTVIKELEKLDINSLTPMEAINTLYELQKKAKEDT